MKKTESGNYLSIGPKWHHLLNFLLPRLTLRYCIFIIYRCSQFNNSILQATTHFTGLECPKSQNRIKVSPWHIDKHPEYALKKPYYTQYNEKNIEDSTLLFLRTSDTLATYLVSSPLLFTFTCNQ